MRRFVLVLTFASVLALTAVWTGRAQQQPGDATPRHGTGKPATRLDGLGLSIIRQSLEPGSYIYWHSHNVGQLLGVEKGRMRLQKRGQPMRELRAEEADFTPPNVPHWHGSTPDSPAVYWATIGGGFSWHEDVTPDVYAGKSR